MRFWHRLLIFGLIIAGVVALRFSGLGSYINLEIIKEQREALQLFVREHYGEAVFFYIVVYITLVILALPLAALMSLVGGFLFGTFPATIYINIGATLGALGSFMLVRHLIGKAVQERFKGQLERFNYYMHQYGTMYLLTIHFIPVIPFFVINMLAGLTQVHWWTFVWTTSLGILPSSAIYAFAGQQLNHIDSIRDVFTPRVLLAFGLLALLAFLPVFITLVRTYGKKSSRP